MQVELLYFTYFCNFVFCHTRNELNVGAYVHKMSFQESGCHFNKLMFNDKDI